MGVAESEPGPKGTGSRKAGALHRSRFEKHTVWTGNGEPARLEKLPRAGAARWFHPGCSLACVLVFGWCVGVV